MVWSILVTWAKAERMGAMQITTPPAGIVNVGGYRFPEREMQAIVSKLDSASTLAMLPDALAAIGSRAAPPTANASRTLSPGSV